MSDGKEVSLFEAVFLMVFLAAIGIGIGYIVFSNWVKPTPPNIAIGVGIAVAYLAVAYFFVPPDFDASEIRLIDNPFTFRDDIARSLFILNLAIIPGVIYVHACAALIAIMRGR